MNNFEKRHNTQIAEALLMAGKFKSLLTQLEEVAEEADYQEAFEILKAAVNQLDSYYYR